MSDEPGPTDAERASADDAWATQHYEMRKLLDAGATQFPRDAMANALAKIERMYLDSAEVREEGRRAGLEEAAASLRETARTGYDDGTREWRLLIDSAGWILGLKERKP